MPVLCNATFIYGFLSFSEYWNSRLDQIRRTHWCCKVCKFCTVVQWYNTTQFQLAGTKILVAGQGFSPFFVSVLYFQYQIFCTLTLTLYNLAGLLIIFDILSSLTNSSFHELKNISLFLKKYFLESFFFQLYWVINTIEIIFFGTQMSSVRQLENCQCWRRQDHEGMFWW